MSKQGRTAHLDKWRRSRAFREIARNTLRRINAERQKVPKCGASAKSTGEPCQQPAMENGRCYYHGGRTPKGNNWHMTAWPERTSKGAMARLSRKLKDLDRRHVRRSRRLAAMTPEERQRYEEWKRAHTPGPPGPRAAKRAERARNKALRAQWLAQFSERPAPSAEAKTLSDEIDRFKHMLEEMKRAQKAAPEIDELGVFG